MRALVEATLAKLPSKESMVQWPPEAVATVEVLTKLVLILCDELEARDKRIADLEEEVRELKRKLNTNSGNSGISPSQDPHRPRGKGGKEKGEDNSDKPRAENQGENSKPDSEEQPKCKQGGQKGHKGNRQGLRKTQDIREILPERCSCGCEEFVDLRSFYTHQHCELPDILLHVIHFNLYKGRCANCAKEGKAKVPAEYSTGYGPNFTAFVGSASAFLGCTRRSLLDFLTKSDFFRTEEGESVPLSLGGLDRLIDRCSRTLKRHWEKIGEVARETPINYVDETSWPMFGPLGAIKYWLWLMASSLVVFFNIHRHRSREAFHELIGAWLGILISDDYALYRSWPKEKRQSCLAHHLRTAQKLREDPDPDIARGGESLYKEIHRLTQMNPETLTRGVWQGWLMRTRRLLKEFSKRSDGLGVLASRLEATFESLSTFLRIRGVERTNNKAERTLRPAVVRRKVSFGCTSERGQRWMERALSLMMTCRLNDWSFFTILRARRRQTYPDGYATGPLTIR